MEEDVWAEGEGRRDSRLHSEEINDFYYPPAVVLVIKLRRMRWAGLVACMGDRSGVCRVLVGKSGERKLLGRPRCRWENNPKFDQFTALNQQNA